VLYSNHLSSVLWFKAGYGKGKARVLPFRNTQLHMGTSRVTLSEVLFEEWLTGLGPVSGKVAENRFKIFFRSWARNRKEFHMVRKPWQITWYLNECLRTRPIT
jgi:hypothetical protein